MLVVLGSCCCFLLSSGLVELVLSLGWKWQQQRRGAVAGHQASSRHQSPFPVSIRLDSLRLECSAVLLRVGLLLGGCE